MNQSTKRRIVGTVVLLALALIFLPIVFDGQGSYQTQLFSRVPTEPIIPVLPEPTQVRPVILADSLPEEIEDSEAESIADEAGEDSFIKANASRGGGFVPPRRVWHAPQKGLRPRVLKWFPESPFSE